jgi:putative transposase
MRQPRLKAPKHLPVAHYHCISRVVDRRFVLLEPEKEMFVGMMRMYEKLCGVRVLTFCVLANHFHILLEVPRAPATPPDEAWLVSTVRSALGKTRAHLLAEELRQFHAAGAHDAAKAVVDSWLARMWDVSAFMKLLKQHFTQWFNHQHGRKGTLWEERFRSVLVEGGGTPLALVASYVDLNPLRADIVKDPKDYRWCGYAQAVAGIKRAREGLQIAVQAQRQSAPVPLTRATDEYRALLLTWGQNRGLKTDGSPLKRGFDRKDAARQLAKGARLSHAQLLRCKVRYFTDGAVIGGRAFVNDVFEATRERYGSKRKDGARKCRGVSADAEIFVLRDLRREIFQ